MCTCDPRSAVACAAVAFPIPSLFAINCATTAVCGKHTRPVAADRNTRFQPPLRERRWLFAAPTRSATKANTARDQALACGARWRSLHPKSATPTFDAGARARHEAELREHSTSHARGAKAQPRRREQSRINEWRATQLRGHDAAAHTAAAAIRPSDHATRRADGDNLKHTPEKAARQSAWSMATAASCRAAPPGTGSSPSQETQRLGKGGEPVPGARCCCRRPEYAGSRS
ncbi:hypothetical protein ERJ75_001676600 [Trypanosoma vivax]|nr:hypothetical protein ERJ75_001676600 [Trypanosoma vivax]